MELTGSPASLADLTGIPGRDLFEIFNQLKDYVCVHSVELDEFGDVSDARLRVWNRSYEEVRTRAVHVGQSLVETYFEPQVALDFVNRAWREGMARQVFELSPATRDRYRTEGALVLINVLWQRVGDFVIEIGNDLSEQRQLELKLADEESAAAAAIQARAVAEERERIARDLHDSVLQKLFACALQLDAVAVTSLDCSFRDEVRMVAATVTDIISEIRAGIIEIRKDLPSSLETELQSVVELLAHASGVRCTVIVDDDVDCDGEIRSNLRIAVRELVTNAVKHSQAATITVTVHREGNDLAATVSDDGVGLAPDRTRSSGLTNLHRRAAQFGGTMSLHAGERSGTTVVWRVPLPTGRKP